MGIISIKTPMARADYPPGMGSLDVTGNMQLVHLEHVGSDHGVATIHEVREFLQPFLK